jgi:hypothetical protein
MFISFRTINNTIYPVIIDIAPDENSLGYDVENRKTVLLMTSLLEKNKGIFILLNKNNELTLSNGHFEKTNFSLFINRSYLSFWKKTLLELNSFSVLNLFNSI